MKMIPSRELSSRPGAILDGLAAAGAIVVTRDGQPVGILTPTCPATLVEDVQEIAFAKARRAVRAIREAAAAAGAGSLNPAEIGAEIRAVRRGRKR